MCLGHLIPLLAPLALWKHLAGGARGLSASAGAGASAKAVAKREQNKSDPFMVLPSVVLGRMEGLSPQLQHTSKQSSFFRTRKDSSK
jgi:hypothetical protein